MNCKKYRELISDFIKVNKVSMYRVMRRALAQNCKLFHCAKPPYWVHNKFGININLV